MRDGSLETLPPFRDPHDELLRYRYKQAGAGLLFGLALAAIVVMARLENDPTSPWGRILTALAVIGATTGGTVLFSALMSHVEGSEKALSRDTARPGALYSDKGSIAADEADAHPRLVALAGDINARRRRRLPVRVELLPGQMIISRAGVGRSDGGASATLGSGELVSAEVVPLIYGSGLAVRMRDGTAFAVALPVSASRLSRKLARWRNTPAPAFSFPGAEHYAGFLQPVTPAATTLSQTATRPPPAMPRAAAPRVRTLPGHAPSWPPRGRRSTLRRARAGPRSAPAASHRSARRRRRAMTTIIAVAAIGGVATPILVRELSPCVRADHYIGEANQDLTGNFGQVEDLRTVLPSPESARLPVVSEHALGLSEAAGPGQDAASWASALRRYGFVSGEAESFDTYPSVAEQVLQLRSHNGALAFQAWAANASCGAAARAFSLPEVTHSVGLQTRITGSGEWTQVSFVRGARRYLIWVAPSIQDPAGPMSLVELVGAAAAIVAQ